MIDFTFFGYGAGLVLFGWVLGSIIASVFAVFRKAGF